MELVLQKQSNQLAQTGSSPISSYGGGGGSGAGGGMGNLAQELIQSLQDLTSNIRRLITVVQFNTKALSNNSSSVVPSSSGGGLENQIESNRARDDQTVLLGKIEFNTRGMGGGKVQKKQSDETSDFGIGKIGFIIAASLGTVAGLFMSQIKTMKFFGKLLMEAADGLSKVFSKVIKFLKLDDIQAKIGAKFNSIVDFVEGVISSIKNKITKIGSLVTEFFTSSINTFKKYFSFFEDSKIGQILKGAAEFVSNTVMRFIEPFKTAFSALGETGPVMKFIQNIKDFFSGIGQYLSKFSGVFSVVSKLVAKIAYPIQIIMGIFDTVTGAIEGFKKEGILGAIQGGITGLINGVFNSFFDLIKDGISWVLGAVGFKDAEKFLDSFSFSNLFSDFMDKLFHPIRTLQEMFDNLDLKALVFEPLSKVWGVLNDSLGGIPQQIVDNINTYVIQPLKSVFEPVINFFKEIKDKVLGFFTSIVIPGISVKIPFKDEPFKIGPFYPFKSSGGDTTSPQPTASTSPTPTPAVSPQPTPVAPKAAETVYNASKQNADASMSNSRQGNNTSVVAPTINNTTRQTQLIQPPIRNQESSVNSWLRSKYA